MEQTATPTRPFAKRAKQSDGSKEQTFPPTPVISSEVPSLLNLCLAVIRRFLVRHLPFKGSWKSEVFLNS